MQDKTTIHMVPEPRKTELVNATYGIVGAMIEVYKNLGAGLPEYIYQEAGNVIVECKALTALTEREHYQTFGYLRGTGWPMAILVNFGASPRAQIERFYNDNNTIAVF